MLSVHVALIGPGLVGSAFIRQLQAQISSLALLDLLGASIKLVTVTNSKRMVNCSSGSAGFVSDEWRGRLTDEVPMVHAFMHISGVAPGSVISLSVHIPCQTY